MNQITLIGTIKAENGVETKTSQGGTEYANFTLVVPRSGPNAKGQDFFRITCWRDLATRAGSELSNGALVAVTGKHTNDRRKDETTDTWKDNWNVHATDFTVAGGERTAPAAAAPAPAPAAATPTPAAAALDDDF